LNQDEDTLLERIYDEQAALICENFGTETACNWGSHTDLDAILVETKVYGYGVVLVSSADPTTGTIAHEWFDLRDDQVTSPVAATKKRWRRVLIECELTIKQRFELIAMVERAHTFNGRVIVSEAPPWALKAGVLRRHDAAYEFNMDWMRREDKKAERRFLLATFGKAS